MVKELYRADRHRDTDQYHGGIYQTVVAVYATVRKRAGRVIMKLIEYILPVGLPVLFSAYFDIFDGLIQAYVFVFLTGLFIKESIE